MGRSQASKVPSCWPTRTPRSPATVKGLRASVWAWMAGKEVSNAMGGRALKAGAGDWEKRGEVETRRRQNVRRMWRSFESRAFQISRDRGTLVHPSLRNLRGAAAQSQ